MPRPEESKMTRRGAVPSLPRRPLKEFDEEVREAVKAVTKIRPIAVVLFGSRARGERGGDVDLLVVKESDLPRPERQRELYRHRPEGIDVDLLWYTPRELALYWGRSTFINEVMGEGVVVYESERGALERAVEEGKGWVEKEGLKLEEWPLCEARGWLKGAKENLEAARMLAEGGRYNEACFLAHQAAEKALKALIIAKEGRGIRGHEVSRILREARKHAPELARFEEGAGFLDPLYIDTRYPDAEGYRAFSREEARRAIAVAEGTLTSVEGKIRHEGD